MPRPHSRRRLLASIAAVTTLALTPAASLTLLTPPGAAAVHAKPAKQKNVKLQILAINDFHGQLEPSTSSTSGVINGIDAGGAVYLATHLKQLRRQAAREGRSSVTVAAGDLIGASPLLSAAFHDEPTIEAMNKMGLEISSVGNHEFDEGWEELVRMQDGGCLDDGEDGENNQNSCVDHTFKGARFQYLSANVFHEDSGRTVFPSVQVKKYHGVKVGFIGMTLENTPNIVTKSGVEGLRFTDEVETANTVAKRLNKRGVKSIVVLVHEGGFPADPKAYNSCPGISGPIVDINKGLSPRIDAVVSGHTHQAYNCRLKDPNDRSRLVTSGASLGRLVTDIDLTINRRTGDVIRRSEVADNHIVTRDVAENAQITKLMDIYQDEVKPIASRLIGHLSGTTTLSRDPDPSGESPVGNLIADAQRADRSTITEGKTPEIAFMNPGGIRADLQAPGGSVTFGAAFSVQPFNNFDVSMDMTGAQILTLLQQQWTDTNAEEPKILQVSGITYSYRHPSPTAPYTLLTDTVKVNGAVIDPARTYRVVANSFLSDGGDGFEAFAEAQDKFFGGLDIDALAEYLGEHDPYSPPATDRITLVP